MRGSNNEELENSEFKPVKLRLKIDLVSYPARAEGLVNMNNEELEKVFDDKRFKEKKMGKKEKKNVDPSKA